MHRCWVVFGISVCLLLAGGLAGCGLFGIGGKMPQGGSTIAGQYDGLAGRSAAIVVYAPSATVNEYAGAREEISAFVASDLREKMPTIRMVRPADVIGWQNRTLNWQALREKTVGKTMGVDRVLFIEVLEYDVRRTVGHGELQGRLRANCKVFEVEAEGDGPAWSGVVDVLWPPNKPLDGTQINTAALRLRTLEAFAAELGKHLHQQ